MKERLIHRGVVFGTKRSLRRISHKISDIIYSKIHGIPGIFSTQIAYIDKPSVSDPNYNLMISDLDGFQSLSLFSSPQPLMSPSWSPDRKKIAYVSFEEGTSRIFIQQLSNAERFGLKLERGINSSRQIGHQMVINYLLFYPGQVIRIFLFTILNFLTGSKLRITLELILNQIGHLILEKFYLPQIDPVHRKYMKQM